MTKDSAHKMSSSSNGVRIVSAVALVLLMWNSVTIIPAGFCGVVDMFGSVSSATLSSGLNFRNPLARVVRFSLQTMLLEFHEDVPSNEGLTIGLDVSVLYKVNAKSVRDLYITVGSDYRKVLVQPEIRSAIRDLTGSTSAKSLYSEGREGLSKGALKELNTRLNDRGVIVEQVMLRGVHLPEQLQQAIQAKLQSEQESQRMEFVLLKEKQEAQRKGIEAQGISDFQQIVSQGISEQLLQWKGIEATEKLAMSDNAKIVMFGNPANGLPTILGGMLGSTGGFTGPKVTSPLVTKGTQTAQNNEQVLKTGSDSTDASAPSTSSARKLLEEA